MQLINVAQAQISLERKCYIEIRIISIDQDVHEAQTIIERLYIWTNVKIQAIAAGRCAMSPEQAEIARLRAVCMVSLKNLM